MKNNLILDSTKVRPIVYISYILFGLWPNFLLNPKPFLAYQHIDSQYSLTNFTHNRLNSYNNKGIRVRPKFFFGLSGQTSENISDRMILNLIWKDNNTENTRNTETFSQNPYRKSSETFGISGISGYQNDTNRIKVTEEEVKNE